MIRLATLAATVLLTGCASFTEPTNELRVSEYDGSVGDPSPLPLGAGSLVGCRIVVEGELPDGLVVDYQGKRCKVRLDPASLRGMTSAPE